ncbi:MAG TPA: hypothetical protein VKS21_07745 [Spirochaetota bacterium]|nr:hypothetical protein [Spirochaetota bacterium]
MRFKFLLLSVLIFFSIPAAAETNRDAVSSNELPAGDPFGEAEAIISSSSNAEDTIGEKADTVSSDILSGYLESRALLLHSAPKQEWLFQNANKLKLKLDKSFNRINFHSEINFSYYAGHTRLCLLEYLPQKQVKALSNLFGTNFSADVYNYNYNNRITVFRAYGVITLPRVSFFIGRQPVTCGTGYVWNPVDPVNKKDMLDPDYELPPLDALRVMLPLPAVKGELNCAYGFRNNFKDGEFLAFIRAHAWLDWHLVYAYYNYHKTDFLTGLTTSGKRSLIGAAFAGQAGEVGIHGEAAYHTGIKKKATAYFSWLAGFDYTFTFQNRIMAEFYRNDSGSKNSQQYTLQSWLSYINMEQGCLGKNYLYLSSTQILFDITELSLSALINLSDSSYCLMPQYKIMALDQLDILLRCMIMDGSKGSEFAAVNESGELRINFYF